MNQSLPVFRATLQQAHAVEIFVMAVPSPATQSLVLFTASALAFVWWKRLSPAGKYRGIETQQCPTIAIDDALHLADQDAEHVVIIDTRTPKEFKEAHVWGAINIPLLSDDQRHLVGLTYHKQSRAAAILVGWTVFAPRMHSFMQQFEKYRHYKHILVYCWRGGMRSRIVVNLMQRHGYQAAQQITGGYKLYLNQIVWKGLDQFAKSYPPKFIVLFGHTGTRKTEILRKLRDDRGLPVLDLEGLAGHRSSVYGAVDLEPKSQKMFSIGIYHTLVTLQNEPFIFLEGEANKVGDVHVPSFLCDRIASDIKVLVKATIDTRIDAINKEYFKTDDSVRQLHEATEVVRKYVGNANADHLHDLLDKGERRSFTEWLLVNHYDGSYRFDKKGHEYDIIVESNDIEECCTKLEDFYRKQLTEYREG